MVAKDFPKSLLEKLPLARIRQRPPVVGVLRLHGTIGRTQRLGSGLALSAQARAIQKVFSLRRLKAVALAINSPGGSPVQAALIAQRIRALAEEKEIPVYAFAEDVAASGGYMLALAADEIYADPNSIIGSIGVISAGFGFDRMLRKLGVDRRLYAAGERKGMLDPFQPEKKGDVARLKALQKEIHGNFKALVRERRGSKLKGSDRTLYSGEFWTGEKALKLGLIDGLGDLRTVMREKYGDKVRLRLVAEERSWRLRLPFGSSGPAAFPGLDGLVDDLVAAAEDRALWSRFGL